MVDADRQEKNTELLLAVRPAEVALLVDAFRRAQAAEDAVRTVLADCGIPVRADDVAATVDADGKPGVRVVLPDAADRERFSAALSLIREQSSRPSGAA